MTDGPLIAHSLAEVHLYLMVTPCPNCGRGPLNGSQASLWQTEHDQGVALDTTCRSCKHEFRLRFRLPPDQFAVARQATPPAIPTVNPADGASQIIDVAGWVTLFRIITETAAKTPDKAESRRLGYEAALCLEEALKFYEDDNDLPPDTAFFSEAPRERYRERPQLLARSRLINLRAKLPTLDAMQKRLMGLKRASEPWWKIWKPGP